jgi:pyruvate/2-oxoglutarate dehydrogenase complex dihydrolipoamide dehydrogenase (E3) component
MAAEQYTNLIIGSGEAGKFMAWTLAAKGQKTVVVERRYIGGSCPNTNCLPSKNEVWSAKVADLAHHAAKFGSVTGPVTTDMAAVVKRKLEMVEGLIQMHLDRYKKTGAELTLGTANFIGPRIVEVKLNDGGTRTIEGERVFLNLGTHAAIPAVPGLAESAPLTHVQILELDRLPEHLVVIGGGYVGLEFAQAYRRLGSKVTILQLGAQLLTGSDPDVVSEITSLMKDEGVDVITSADIKSVEGKSGSGVNIRVETPAGARVIEASDILVATGRIPNTRGMGLDAAGVTLEANGYIRVNDRLETTAPNVWALGECAGSPQFTHISMDDFRVVSTNLAGGSRTTRGRFVPSCLFTDPQVAHIGLSELEAEQNGIPVRVARIPMMAVLRTRTIAETRGFAKALIELTGDKILGFTMVGPEAGEVMASVQVAMMAGLPYTALRDAIMTHPTMSETLNVLFSAVKQVEVGVAAQRAGD